MAQKIKLIIGSTRQNRISPQIAEWVKAQAQKENVELEVLDLKEINLPAFDAPVPPAYAPTETPEGKAWAEQISSADGFVFLTSEYNRSIPSSLKNAIDYLAVEWKDKPAAIVSYGYIDGGGSATKHLTDIFGWLKIKLVEPTVALQLQQEDFEDGVFTDINATFAAHETTMSEALKQLV